VSSPVPKTFRRESRLFLWIALLLVLFLNVLTLVFFRRAVEWGSASVERRAGEILKRLPPSADAGDTTDEVLGRAVLAQELLYAAVYDREGRRLRTFGHMDAPESLSESLRPVPGEVSLAWRRDPTRLVATRTLPAGFVLIALDPAEGAALRSLASALTFVVPIAGGALVVLAGFYLRSLLDPYDRLLAAAGSAPEPASATPGTSAAPGDERDFLVTRFEATIAALREKERELKARADDLETAARLLSRNLPTGLLSVDASGTIVELNESGRDLLRLPGDAHGERYDAALAAIPEFREALREVLDGRESVGRREIRWVAEGAPRSFGVTATPAHGADGRFLGVLALFTDLTEMRKLEARVALTRHLSDLGQVSAGAAHEFRNASAAIDGFADLGLRSPERAAEHLRAIRREAQEMNRVTSDFLLFARPEGFVPEPVDLAAVAAAAAAETETAFPGAVVERRGAFPGVAGSEVLLRRALVNLLRNAAEATPAERRREPGAIRLDSWERDGEVFLAVGDRGEGVETSLREEIFLPFYSTKPRGSGFGLAIVARIAELHGGTVEVGLRPDGGALFTLRLPASAGEPRPSPPPPV
jgi:signal transduction histidine kinase